jgi:hypothetical protein
MIQLIRLTNLGIVALLVAHLATAQTVATGSISGHVVSEQGLLLRATVTLSFASARGYPAPPRRVLTGSDGAFSFSHLAAGSYALCAQVLASEPAPANSPYVDTCVWGSGQAPVTLATGQQLAGIVFTAQKGAWLQVHVSDPDSVLPQAAAKGPAPLEPALQLILKGPDKFYRHAAFVSSDSTGRNYQMAVPLKTALSMKVTSTVANVYDQNGNQLQETDETPFQPATAADLAPVTFTLHQK